MENRTDLAGQAMEIAPPFEGVSFRHFRGEDDYGEIARLLMATSRADGGYRFETAERVARGYANLYNCDPYTDMIFAEVDGVAVAYSRCLWEQELEGTRAYGAYGWVDPAFRHRGIGTAMYNVNEARLRAIATGHPADVPKKMTSFSAESDVGGVKLLESQGFTPEMYIADMIRHNLDDIPGAPMPEGLVVRMPTPDEYRKVFDADVEAFRDHQGSTEPQEAWFEEWISDPNFDPSLWKIAWDGDEVAGQVRSFIDKEQNEEYGRQRGWTEDISTRRPYRARGLARSLLCQSLEAVRDAGMKEAALSVHTDNPLGAYKLYESVGFVIERQVILYSKPL